MPAVKGGAAGVEDEVKGERRTRGRLIVFTKSDGKKAKGRRNSRSRLIVLVVLRGRCFGIEKKNLWDRGGHGQMRILARLTSVSREGGGVVTCM